MADNGIGRRRAGGDAARRRRLATLGPDALALLDALGAARVATADQVAALAGSRAAARVGLAALRAAGLVESVPYRAGARAPLVAVWSLTPLGARAAAARLSHGAGEGGAGDPLLTARARRLRAGALSMLFLAHGLRLTDLFVALRRELGADAFVWRSGEEARVSFRSLASTDGRGVVVPDAVAAPAALWPGADALALGGAALELDRGTMGRAAIEAKLWRYRELVADRGRFGPVLFVADAAARRAQLGRWLAESGLEGAAVDPDEAVRRVGEALAALAPTAPPEG